MTEPSLRLGPNGLEVVRTAPPEDAARLRSTIARLRSAAGLGVVELIDAADGDDHVRLVLAHAGRPIAARLGADEAARVGAAVAATLNDLHQIGVVHGDVRRDHVLMDAHRTIRVCGLGGVAGAEPSDDVAALGSLLREALDDDDMSDGARSVRATAERCCAEDPAARPSMAAVASALAGLSGPRAMVASRAPQPRSSQRRSATALGAVAAIAVTTFVVAAFVDRGGATAPVRQDVATRPTSSVSVTTTSATSTPVRVWPQATARHIVGAGATWTLGTVEDQVLLGSFACDEQIPVVVRADGSIWLVDDWKDGAMGRFVTSIHDIDRAFVEHDGACDHLVVVTTSGQSIRPSMTEA